MKKGINLDVIKKYDYVDLKSFKKLGDDESDIIIIEYFDEDMVEGKKKGFFVWFLKIVFRIFRVSRVRMDFIKFEKKVIVILKVVCEVKDSDIDELIKVGFKYNMDSEDISKYSDDVEKESD